MGPLLQIVGVAVTVRHVRQTSMQIRKILDMFPIIFQLSIVSNPLVSVLTPAMGRLDSTPPPKRGTL